LSIIVQNIDQLLQRFLLIIFTHDLVFTSKELIIFSRVLALLDIILFHHTFNKLVTTFLNRQRSHDHLVLFSILDILSLDFAHISILCLQLYDVFILLLNLLI